LSRWRARSANLRGADLSGANLRSADLRSADLSSANLRSADLRSANLCGANLCGANLRGANLRGADLSSANLSSADLRGANLRGADLSSANLSGANLSGAKNAELPIAMTCILPDGDLIGWKKCRDGAIVKLLIPATAKRSHAFCRKCRAESAKVLEITKGGKPQDSAFSSHDSSFLYEVGETVAPKEPFSTDWQSECASGIHFFITKLEAENY
jgi:uncharacterized protein YjbI with pentapeptide repeats